MTYAFIFDASFCSGCKACQAACKDKNNLPVGVLWRRVIEVSGGAWQNVGVGSPNPVWENSVFAYNLSVACNHCVHPKCAGVCPVDAYDVRADGIVVLDSSKCMGCGYCAWACPYGAPQYNPEAGTMTKCDFCLDQLEHGLPPACVAACPMRVLDFGEAETRREFALWQLPAEEHPFPLPTFSHTQPRLAVQPHAAMNCTDEKSVANLEEIQPRNPSAWEEAPLILFTLLGQLAVGGFWAASWLFPPLWTLADRLTTPLRLIPHLIVGLGLGLGLLASFAHLGSKRNAWRALTHLSHSWLSREILFAILFGLGWLITTVEGFFLKQFTSELTAIVSILGIGLIYSMGQIYRLPAAPGWNDWRTNAGFFVSAFLLGLSAMSSLLTYEARLSGVPVPPIFWMFVGTSILLALLVQLAMTQKWTSDILFHSIRFWMIIFGVALTVVGIFYPAGMDWLSWLIFLTVLTEETLGRWLFYRSRL
jgi:DMSO reductase iron-sulfur subunit